jgi:PAS domain S-box-containing protein
LGSGLIYPLTILVVLEALAIGVLAVWLRRLRREARIAEQLQCQFSSLFEGIHDAAFIHDETGRILSCNSAACEHFGYSCEELHGMNVRDVDAPEFATGFEQRLQEQLANGSYACEGLHVTKAGERIPVDITTSLIEYQGKSAVMAVMSNISRRLEAEENYQLLFNQMLSGFALHEIICDDQGIPYDYRFLEANPAFEVLTGLRADDIRGKTVREVMPDIEEHWINIYGEVALTGEPVHFGNYSEPLGKYFEVTAFSPRTGQFATVFRDVTDRQNAEAERRNIEEQMRHAQKLESLGVLAGGIAHDFNNLLMGIIGNADFALDEVAANSKARDNIQEMRKAAKHASDLCRQMLAYSGRGEFSVAPLNFNELVEEIAGLLQISVSKRVAVQYELAADLPLVEGDATQLRQVVMNLITNASDAIGDKNGSITVTTGTMDCDLDYLQTTFINERLDAGLYVFFEVADTGCGMTKETIEKIFDPFFTTKVTGRGLGLAAVLGIIQGHRGAVKVYSEPDRGTTFKVLLPAAQNQDLQQFEKGAHAPEMQWHPEGEIMLVDDDETVRFVGKHMLEKTGFVVTTCADGQEAIAEFKEAPDKYDCVILDLTMPQMDGSETFHRLRRLRKDIKIILSSGYNEQEIAKRFAGRRIDGFLQKPYESATLRKMLFEVLGEGGAG